MQRKPNGGIQDSIPVVDPDDPLNQQGDPNQGQGQQNPLSSATGPVNPQSSNAQPGISSATQPGISSSSAQTPAMSSSVGLKEYDDNHKAKATFLPKAGFYSNLTIPPRRADKSTVPLTVPSPRRDPSRLRRQCKLPKTR